MAEAKLSNILTDIYIGIIKFIDTKTNKTTWKWI